jgi:hypothetical protein
MMRYISGRHNIANTTIVAIEKNIIVPMGTSIVVKSQSDIAPGIKVNNPTFITLVYIHIDANSRATIFSLL